MIYSSLVIENSRFKVLRSNNLFFYLFYLETPRNTLEPLQTHFQSQNDFKSLLETKNNRIKKTSTTLVYFFGIV